MATDYQNPYLDYNKQSKDKDDNKQPDPGFNRYQQIMDAYARYKPGAGEYSIKEAKMAMAGNMTEKAFDHDMAKDMAFTQAGIGSELALHEANLQMRNETEARSQEFDYGMATMGAQFEHQNNYANAQYDRDIGMLNASGVQDRSNMDKAGPSRAFKSN